MGILPPSRSHVRLPNNREIVFGRWLEDLNEGNDVPSTDEIVVRRPHEKI
jgi:hypothetical protein